MKEGVRPQDIRCNGNNSATATATSASKTGGGNGAGETGGAGGSATPGAGVMVAAPMAVSKAGLGMLGMIVVSVFAGAIL